ncbi:MAG: hypothetical protein RSB86_11185 [Comamonas sp.]|uniref:hypothetical protein n=1 Tax=Comamonas sp. TaxID=34028 RepID=UPI002FC8B0DC
MTFVQKINKLREEIQQVNEELKWLEDSPITKEEFKARVVEWVRVETNNAEDVDRRLAYLRHPDASAHRSAMLEISTRAHVPGGTHPTIAPVDFSIAPQLAWLFGDQIKQTLLAKVDAMDYVPGLPLAERPARRKQLEQNRRVLEEKEEALICESEEANTPVHRRADADPAVVLGYEKDGVMGAEGERKVYVSRQSQPSDPAVSQAIGQSIIPLALPR